MRIGWRHLVFVAVGIPVAAVLVSWIGFFNVGASTGHWKITDWFLHFAMRSAVRTYAIGVEVPPLDDPSRLQPAAGHYERGCAICHGAPGLPRSPVVLNMLPLPPDLAPVVGEWQDRELFRIVKHGVRFTAMPAWPSQARDDEVWSMVAFLRALPGMDEATYRNLAFGSSPGQAGNAGFDAALAGCARCHGVDGQGRSARVPVISGLDETYFVDTLEAFAEGRRESGVMELAAIDADPALWDDLARHYAGQARRPVDAASAGDAGRGREIAENGLPAQGVPACLSCHGQGRDPAFPPLDGQHATYLEVQLALFAAGLRGGTPHHHLMARAAKDLTERDMRDAAAYFAQRPYQAAR